MSEIEIEREAINFLIRFNNCLLTLPPKQLLIEMYKEGWRKCKETIEDEAFDKALMDEEEFFNQLQTKTL